MIFLAIRYLLARKRQTFLTLMGVFFGTLAYVSVSGFFLGFQNYMIQQLVNSSAQIHIQARLDSLYTHQLDTKFFGNEATYVNWKASPSGIKGYLGIQNPQSWYARLRADSRVEAFSPLMSAPALFNLSKISLSASLIGCNPIQQSKVTSIADYMISGSFSDLQAGGNRLILGDEISRRLGVGIGQYILVSVGLFPPEPFKVVGRFQTGNRGSDMQAYAQLADVQKLNRTPNRVSEIAVRLKDYTQAAMIAYNWSKLAPELTESWDQQNASILSVIRMQTALRFAMIFTVLLVAGFGIYNVLNMTVTQKRQDIAILRSMGYDTFDIVTLFFSQGLIVGIFGSILGSLGGYLVCLYLETIPFSPVTATSTSGHLRILFSLAIYFQAFVLALFSAGVASILPARSAGKLTPIEIIRMGTQ
jgi:lipoprotein-releasing system permease protein